MRNRALLVTAWLVLISGSAKAQDESRPDAFAGDLQTEFNGKTAEEIARALDADPEDVFHTLQHLASNDSRVQISKGDDPSEDKFSIAE